MLPVEGRSNCLATSGLAFATVFRHKWRMKFHHLTASETLSYWENVDRRDPNECWPWTGPQKRGYGRSHLKREGRWRSVQATHMALHLDGRPRHDNLFALHACDNPNCVNPRHLRWGTDQDNAQDRVARGRTISPPHFGSANGKSKLTEADVKRIHALKGKMKVREIAEAFGLHEITIYKIRSGRLWPHVTPLNDRRSVR
jgi:hypothetical protein